MTVVCVLHFEKTRVCNLYLYIAVCTAAVTAGHTTSVSEPKGRLLIVRNVLHSTFQFVNVMSATCGYSKCMWLYFALGSDQALKTPHVSTGVCQLRHSTRQPSGLL